jgi:hypothetical protein
MKYRIERWSYNVCTDAVETDSWDIIQDIIKTKKFSEDSDNGECIFEVFADGEMIENPFGREPKDYWFIGAGGEVMKTDRGPDDKDAKQMQSIGNYFETKEEAEKAVEKLKAWKRLKGGGFVFCGKGDCLDTIKFDYWPAGYNRQDFALLFGEECKE